MSGLDVAETASALGEYRLRIALESAPDTVFRLVPSSHREIMRLNAQSIIFDLPPGAHTYLRPDDMRGLEARPASGLTLVPGATYTVSARLWATGDLADLWILEFDGDRRVAHQRLSLRNGDVARSFDTADEHDLLAFAIRFEGSGALSLPMVRLERATAVEPVLTPSFHVRRPAIVASGFGHLFERFPEADAIADAWRNGIMFVHGEWVTRDPIDWEYASDDRTLQFKLHSWFFCEPLLQRAHHDRQLLTEIFRTALNWIEDDESVGHGAMGWYSHAVAARTVNLTRLLAVAERIPIHRAREQIEIALVRHARHLADPENYEHLHNHGLFMDYALATAAAALEHPQSIRWTRIARRRFAATLDATVDLADAVHLEHSPEYHRIVGEFVDLAQSIGLAAESRFRNLGSRMRDSLRWMTCPDGQLAKLGDTGDVAGPGRPPEGAKVFPVAGYAMHQTQQSSLHFSAGHHGPAHKHLDDTTLVLWHENQAILVDTGHPGYRYDSADREYAVSGQAHNVCVMHGRERNWRAVPPRGSGIVGSVVDDNYLVILARNPQLARECDPTLRLVILRPEHSLVIVDHARPELIGTRYLHFAPGLSVADQDDQWLIGEPRTPVAILLDQSPAGTKYSLVTPEPGKDLHGCVFSAGGQRLPGTVWEATGQVAGAAAILLLSPGAEGAPGIWTQCLPDGIALSVDYGDFELGVRAYSDELSVEAWH